MEQETKPILLQELPDLLEHNPQIRESIWRMLVPYYMPRQETESRFDRVLGEIQRMREESERKWEEQKRKDEEQREESERKWEEQKRKDEEQRQESERKWQEQNRKDEEQRQESERKWQEQNRKWDENQSELRQMREESERKWNENQSELRQMREESERKWEEQKRKDEEQRQESERKWQEQNRKWDENQATLNHMLNEIARVDKKVDKKVDAKIGALGARWGIDSETTFRNGLRGILEEVAQVQVLHINEFDDTGIVFGHPDQVELDMVIRNGVLMVCEMKSSVSKGDVSTFERKVQFYEQRHQQSVTHKVIISPMVDPRALPLAQQFGMHVYHNAEDVVLDEGDTGAEG